MTQITIDKTVRGYLVDFGLTEKEITIYLTLLKVGPSTIMDLARKTGIKRSTTHNNVEELIKKGLVSQTNYGERRMVIAEDPEKLKFLLEQRRWDVQKLEKNMDVIVKGIYDVIPSAKENSNVEVKYYQGTKGIRLIYEEALQANELRSYVNLEKIKNIFPENESLFVDGQKKNKDLKIYEIVEDSKISRELTKTFAISDRYFYKFISKDVKLTAADVLIYNGKIGIVNATEEPTGIVISNMDYFDNSKTIFDFIWNILPKV